MNFVREEPMEKTLNIESKIIFDEPMKNHT